MSDQERNNLEIKVDQILQTLKGNPWDKEDNGMLGKQHDMELRIFNLEKIIYRYLWMGAGIAVVASGIITIAGLLIEYHIAYIKP